MKHIKFLAIFAIAFIFAACGEKKITVKGADGTEYESYQECCTAQDFQAAHQYLAKMQNDKDFKDDYDSAKDFVFKQEALYLMSLGDETAKKRIIYLLKEEGANDSRIDMLMDLAIDADDEDFVKTLTKQYEGDISSDMLRKIVEFLFIEKGDGNLDFIQTLLNRYNESGLLLDAAVKKGDEALVISLAQQFNGSMSLNTFKNIMSFLSSRNSPQYKPMQNLLLAKVDDSKELFLYALDNNIPSIVNKLAARYIDLHYNYDNNLISKLAAQNKREYSEIMIGLLTKEECSISKKPQMGNVTFYGYGGSDTSDFEEMCDNFSKSVKDFNSICQKILGIAINNKNQHLAQRVVSKFKSDIQVEKIGFVDNVHYRYKITADNGVINEAKATYQEAVKSGAFK